MKQVDVRVNKMLIYWQVFHSFFNYPVRPFNFTDSSASFVWLQKRTAKVLSKNQMKNSKTPIVVPAHKTQFQCKEKKAIR